MADKKTSEETAAAALTGAELVAGVQDGADVVMTAAAIAALAEVGGGGGMPIGFGFVADAETFDGAGLAAGKLAWNQADQVYAAQLFISNLDADGNELTEFLGALNINSILTLRSPTEPGEFLLYRATGPAVAYFGYHLLPVWRLAGDHPFAHDDAMRVEVVLNGSPPFVGQIYEAYPTLYGSDGPSYRLVLTADRHFDAPVGLSPGQIGYVRIVQDEVGGHELTFDPAFKFPGGVPPTLSPAPGAGDLLVFQYEAADNSLWCVMHHGFA